MRGEKRKRRLEAKAKIEFDKPSKTNILCHSIAKFNWRRFFHTRIIVC